MKNGNQQDPKKLWQELFLSLSKEEKRLVSLAPILLKCEEKDLQEVGTLVYAHFINNDEWDGTFRYTAGIIASIFNKRFNLHLDYIDFYCSDMNCWNPKTKKSKIPTMRARMEKKYASKVCVHCSR